MLDWQKVVWEIHKKMTEKAPYTVASEMDKYCLAMGLSGEVGELLNYLKKAWRGDRCDSTQEIEDEVADVAFYTFLLSHVMNLDLNALCESKAAVWISRWPEAKAEIDKVVDAQTIDKWFVERKNKFTPNVLKKKIEDCEFLIRLMKKELKDSFGESENLSQHKNKNMYICYYCQFGKHDQCSFNQCDCFKLEHV